MAEKRNLADECTVPQQQLLPQQYIPSPQPQLPPIQQPQQQQLLVPQQPLVIQVRGSAPKRYDKFQTVRARALGISTIVCAGLAIILNALGWAMQDLAREDVMRETHRSFDEYDKTYSGYGRYYWDTSYGYNVSTGFWCVVFFFISGAFAISASKRPTKCLVITCMVMSIISSVMAAVMFSMAAFAMSQDSQRFKEGFTYTRYYSGSYSGSRFSNSTYHVTNPPPSEHYSNEALSWAKSVMPVSVLFFLVSVVEVVATIWTCVVCCRVLCCGKQQEEAYSGVQYMQSSGQPQILVLDRHGRPVRDAQVIQIPASNQGAAIQPVGNIQPAIQMFPPAGQMIQPAGQMGQPAGQVTQPAGQPVHPAGQVQPPQPGPQLMQIRPPSYTANQGQETQPSSQTGADSPPPPYQ